MDIGAMISDALGVIGDAVWLVMVFVLVGAHVFLTFRTGVIQRKLPQAIKMTFKRDKEAQGDISQFGALTTALSSTIGTGNIVGVATAVLMGGPGAVFWMWIIGVFGIATKYAETFAAVKYRVKDHKGDMLGGAMYAWERGFQKNGKTPAWAKFGAGAFALLAAIAAFGIGSAVQAGALTDVITTNLPSATPDWLSGAAPYIIGILIVISVALVIFGGVRILSKVCERLVPFMAVAYALGCIVILIMNWAYIIPAFALILECAFTNEAAFGGTVGAGLAMALRYGAARGLFSNESGMGSAPIVASAAQTRNPARQSLVSMTGTFWDTVVICLLTGLVLVSTLIANPGVMEGGLINSGAALTSTAFSAIPFVGTPILVVGMILFAYSTILGWSYYGNRCITYLFGKHSIAPYKVVYLIVAFLGAIGIGDLVWTISDITNALMALPNIIVVVMLSGMIARETKHYVWNDNIDEVDETPIPVLENK